MMSALAELPSRHKATEAADPRPSHIFYYFVTPEDPTGSMLKQVSSFSTLPNLNVTPILNPQTCTCFMSQVRFAASEADAWIDCARGPPRCSGRCKYWRVLISTPNFLVTVTKIQMLICIVIVMMMPLQMISRPQCCRIRMSMPSRMGINNNGRRFMFCIYFFESILLSY